MNAPADLHGLLPAERHETHVVLNQASPGIGQNALSGDAVLKAAILREVPWAVDRCTDLGALVGDERIREL
nr:acyl-CoA dehydrogenase [Lautropia sp.]